MGEISTSQPRRFLNQFKNRNVVSTTVDISGDVLAIVGDVTKALSQITSSVNFVSQSLGGISGSLVSQSIQIGNLETTARSIGSNKLFSNKEIPVGAIDGINTTYTLAYEPILGSDHVYLNGLLIEDQNNDYSISGSTLTFANPLLPGMKLNCTYYYQDSTPVKVFRDKEQPKGDINGTNTIFTLNYTPIEDSEHIYLNGLLQENGGDYIISGSTITFIDAPSSFMKLRCTYYYLL
jgi:hypothetical protein